MYTSTDMKLTALRRAAEAAPEYADIAPLFTAVYDYLRGREGETGIEIELSDLDRDRTLQGFPLISPAELSVDRTKLNHFLIGILPVIERHTPDGEVLDRIWRALASGRLDPAPIIPALLEGRLGLLEEAAQAENLPWPLLQYLLEIPLRTSLEVTAAEITEDAFPGWQESICPVCGGHPAMAELVGEEGRRKLCCAVCSYSWHFKRIKCPSCGCEDPEQLAYFTAGIEGTRVDTCRSCGKYIKTRDTRTSPADMPIEVVDLLTMHLDLIAAREGFERGR